MTGFDGTRGDLLSVPRVRGCWLTEFRPSRDVRGWLAHRRLCGSVRLRRNDGNPAGLHGHPGERAIGRGRGRRSESSAGGFKPSSVSGARYVHDFDRRSARAPSRCAFSRRWIRSTAPASPSGQKSAGPAKPSSTPCPTARRPGSITPRPCDQKPPSTPSEGTTAFPGAGRAARSPTRGREPTKRGPSVVGTAFLSLAPAPTAPAPRRTRNTLTPRRYPAPAAIRRALDTGRAAP